MRDIHRHISETAPLQEQEMDFKFRYKCVGWASDETSWSIEASFKIKF